ncbi:MAG: hypothetical protein JJE03_00775 [Peptostreptococcaceae bacterium]|nr:hypothetical protein [Peptostreptococcaceae bacterium]
MIKYFDFMIEETGELVTITNDYYGINKKDILTCYEWNDNDPIEINMEKSIITNIDTTQTVRIFGRFN